MAMPSLASGARERGGGNGWGLDERSGWRRPYELELRARPRQWRRGRKARQREGESEPVGNEGSNEVGFASR